MQAIQGTGHLLEITLEAWNARSLEDQTGKHWLDSFGAQELEAG